MPTLVVGGLLDGLLVTGGLSGGSVVVVTTRDHDLIADVRDRLKAIGVFGDVFFSSPNEGEGRGSDAVSVAFVWPDRWAATDEADDPDGPEERRSVAFNVAIYHSDILPERRYDRLDQLAQAAQNAVTGKCLAGASLIGFTRLRGGRYVSFPPPWAGMLMQGEAVYLVPAYAGRDETDDIDELDP